MIINLPSVEVPSAGTLTLLVTHRFTGSSPGQQHRQLLLARRRQHVGLWALVRADQEPERRRLPVVGPQDLRGLGGSTSCPSSVDSRRRSASAKTGARIRNLSLKKELLRAGHSRVLLREIRQNHRRTDVCPAGERPAGARKLSRSWRSDRADLDSSESVSCSGLYEKVFNVPVAASIAITHSIEIHGEVIPRLSKVNSNGVGWSVSVEKSLLRHRFAFWAGNQRQTTVDRYVQAVPYSAIRRTSTSASTCSGRGTSNE